MLGFLHKAKIKKRITRATNATIASLFIGTQLLMGGVAFAANDNNNGNGPANDNQPVKGSLTINESAPTDGTQAFDFTYSGNPSSFSLKDTESKGFNNLAADQSYTVTQTATDGWNAPSVTCDNASTSGSTVTFTPSADTPDATCTFTNTQDVVTVVTDQNNDNNGNNGNDNQGNNGNDNPGDNNGNDNQGNNGNNDQNNDNNDENNDQNNDNNDENNDQNNDNNGNNGNNDSDTTTCPTGTGLSQQGNTCKITICHRTAAVVNPYVMPTVDLDAADGNAGNDNGNGDHFLEHTGPVFDSSMQQGDSWGDIIPPIPGVHNGLNWTTEGQAIWNNDCKPTSGGVLGSSVGSISGMKFNDANGNGQKDQGEQGLSGWTIFLDTNGNGLLDNGEASTVTGSNGSYSFANLDEGDYRVCEVQQTGWTQTFGGSDQGCYDLTVNADGTLDWHNIDFGNHQLIGGQGGEVLGASTTGQVLGASTLVNTGTPVLVSILVGMTILGSVAGLTVANRRKQSI